MKILFILHVLICSLLPTQAFSLEGKLPNGLSYFIHQNPSSKKKISIDFIVRGGSLAENEKERGFSHLVEHSIGNGLEFKGVKITDPLCPLWDLSAPEFNVFTSYQFTQYHMEISLAIPDGFQEGLKTISSIFTPFSEANFLTSREEVLKEILEIETTPSKKWDKEKIGCEYPLYKNQHPLGDSSCITAASKEELHDFFKKWYQPQNCAIIIVGNVDSSATLQLLENSFGSIPITNTLASTEKPSEYLPEGLEIYYDEKLDQIELTLIKTIPELDYLTFSLWTLALNNHLQAYLPNYNPRLEIISHPKLFRIKIYLSQHDLLKGAYDLSDALSSYEEKKMALEEFNFYKAYIKEALQHEIQNDLYLSRFYRDLFVNESSNELLSPDAIDALSLEQFHEITRNMCVFPRAVLATNKTSFEGDSHDN
ncbi:MAG: insulinase family protein [Rhabdochlamydiaceae bacterium]|nr:insulinase family protein [Rhabdochlamydiaceae bacterium]